MIDIKNISPTARDYVVARRVVSPLGNYDYWYYGSYDNEKTAYVVAEDIGGQVFYRPKHKTEEPDYEPGYDIEMGFDPFLGCYTDDC